MTLENEETAPLSRLAVAFALVAVGILFANVVLVSIDVLMRWLLNDPQSWVSDIAELTYPVAIVCCFPVALEGGSMISIRVFGAVRSARLGWFLDCLGQSALTALLGLFAWKVFWRALSDWHTGFATLTLKIPTGPTWVLVSILLVVSMLFQLRRTWLIIIGRVTNV